MSKSFLLCLLLVFLLICYLSCGFWTLFVVCIVILTFIKSVLIWYEKELNFRRRPGSVSRSKIYIVSQKRVQPVFNKKTDGLCKNIKNSVDNFEINRNFKSFNHIADNDSGFFSQSCQTEMSFFKSSQSSLNLCDSSPVRTPLRIRNDQTEESPNRNSSNTSLNDVRSSSNMSVGEFPLISLVSSLHEAVSPRSPRLQPSPVRIRIKPVQPTEQTLEPVADPVVSVLKQLASNKRVLAPTNVAAEDEQKEKKSRVMPRHDLTHSLLESQLTLNSSRDGTSSKREREEVVCSNTTPCGIPSSSAAKRMCARTLRSNEILSSLSSSISLVSPPNKSYTGKRKNVSFDKYKKVRRIDETPVQPNQSKSPNINPIKIDKGVTTQTPPEKPPLPVISIKKDEVSERVVSRAMVSALLKSTVTKLIMSGDPAVYPVPNGTQSRQPEVTPTEFGPPKPPTIAPTPSLPSGLSLPPTSGLTFNMPQTDKTPVSSPTPVLPGFNFGSQTSSATSATSHTLTTSVQSLSTSSSTPAQPLFSLNKPQISTSAVPTFGLGSTPVSKTPLVPSVPSALPTTSLSTPQEVNSTPIVVSSTPTFSIPTSTVLTTSSTPAVTLTTSIQSQSKPPTFGLTTPSNPTSIPTFGASSVTTTAATVPTFSFGSSTTEAKTTASNAPPTFASVVASSTPSFGLPPISAPSTVASSSLFTPVATSNASTIKFGTSTNAAIPVFGAQSSSAPPSFGSVMTTTSTVTSSTPVFGSTNSVPIFGSNLIGVKTGAPTTTTPVFGTSTPATPSSSLFGQNSSTTSFGSNLTTSAPVFGSTTVTTSAPLFGGSTSTTTSMFGGFTNTNTTTSTPLFGTTTTTSAPLFGSTVPTTAATPLFGASSAVVTPIFGASNTTAPVFGPSSTKTTAAPVFGSSTSLTTSTPLFGGTAATTSTPTPLFGSATSSFASSGFGGSSTSKTTEGLFGMPSSNSGFKATTPFQVGGNDNGNTTSVFGSASAGTPGKAFEFGSSKPTSGGFTFKPTTNVAPFSQAPAAQQPAATPFSQQQQPAQHAPFSFTGGAASSSTNANTGVSPFVFGTPQSQPAAPAPSAQKPFQFGTPGAAAPTFGQSFTPTFGQSAATPNVSFGTPTTPANAGFQFNTPQQSAPGTAGGLFSIGTGSTGTRSRDRKDNRRRRV